jgi:DNA repair protein RecO (recombination protein O)
MMSDRQAVKLSAGAAKAIQHIVAANIDTLFSFNLSDDVLSELGMITHRYLKERLERNYTKLDFLRSIDPNLSLPQIDKH